MRKNSLIVAAVLAGISGIATPLTAQTTQPKPSVAAPRAGEITISGDVIRKDEKSLVVRAVQFVLPGDKAGSYKIGDIKPAKEKTVLVNQNTFIHIFGKNERKPLNWIPVPKAIVRVAGKDQGTGKPLVAREIVIVYPDDKAPTQKNTSAYKGLLQERAVFHTKLIANKFEADGPAEAPRDTSYKVIRYPSPAGELAAYLSNDPGDGKKHPAVLWAHGGFGGISNGDLYQAKVFKDAGFVVMCPSWRGENDNPGKFELFYGEINDAVAALEYLEKLPYVDTSRIYMVGHSTGGTITLLTAQSTPKLRAAFSFGGAPNLLKTVEDGEGYGNTPFDYTDEKESFWRSPINFVSRIKTPTFYFEGEKSFYVGDARTMEEFALEDKAPFKAFIVKGGDHFNILLPLTQMLTKKMLADTGPHTNITISEEEAQNAFTNRFKRQ